MNKWKPVSLAFDIILVVAVIGSALTSHGHHEAYDNSWMDVVWSVVILLAFATSCRNLYNHFKG